MVEANKMTGKSKNQEIFCSELTFGLQQQTMVFFAIGNMPYSFASCTPVSVVLHVDADR